MISLVFIIAAFICFFLATIGVGGKINLIGAGLTCLAASLMIDKIWK